MLCQFESLNKQIFKILMWPCKKYLTYVHDFGVLTKVASMKNMFNFCDSWSIFTWFTAQANFKTGRQINFKLSDGNTFKYGTTGKERSF